MSYYINKDQGLFLDQLSQLNQGWVKKILYSVFILLANMSFICIIGVSLVPWPVDLQQEIMTVMILGDIIGAAVTPREL